VFFALTFVLLVSAGGVLIWRQSSLLTMPDIGDPSRIAIWAANPKTRASDLRRALDYVIACEPRPEWDSSSLKVDYLLAMRELN
jgi:hypothetical protein